MSACERKKNKVKIEEGIPYSPKTPLLVVLIGLLTLTHLSVTLPYIGFDNHLCLDNPCIPVFSLISILSARPMHSVSYWNLFQAAPRQLKFNIHKMQPNIFFLDVLLLLSLCHWRVLSRIQFPKSEGWVVMLDSCLSVNLKPNSAHCPFLICPYPLHSPIMLILPQFRPPSSFA